MGYREQYDRMMRRYGRLEAIAQRGPTVQPTDDDLDDILAFFEACLHLGDWIGSDTSIPPAQREALSKEIVGLVKLEPLSWCRYIALASKHSPNLTNPTVTPKKPRVVLVSDGRTVVENREGRWVVDLPEGVEHPRPVVQTETGREVTPLQLATQCVKVWDGFLAKHNLPK